MTKLFLSLFITILIAPDAFANCLIKTEKTIVVLDSQNLTSSDIVKESDCPEKIITAFVQFNRNFHGTVSGLYLNEALKDERANEEILLSPSKITVTQIDKALLGTENNLKRLAEIRLIAQKRALLIDGPVEISSDLEIDTLGLKSFKVHLSDVTQKRISTLFVQAKLQVVTKVLRAKQNLALSTRELDADQFDSAVIYTEAPERYVQSTDEISFYRLTKPIASNNYLQTTDIIAKELVTTGRPTRVRFKSGALNLEMLAIPLTQGKIGDSITLRHPKSNRKIVGKVTGHNAVVVEM